MPVLELGDTPLATSPKSTEISWDGVAQLEGQLQGQELQGGSRSFSSDSSLLGVTNFISTPI